MTEYDSNEESSSEGLESTLENFVEEFEQNHQEAEKFTKALFYQLYGVMIISLFIAIIVIITIFRIDLPIISTIIRQQFSIGPISFRGLDASIGGTTVLMFLWGVQLERVKNSYEVNEYSVTGHYLARAISAYLDGNYEESRRRLGKFKKITMPNQVGVFSKLRVDQITSYYDYIKYHNNADELLEESFDRFVAPACEDALNAIKTDDQLEEIFEELQERIQESDDEVGDTRIGVLADVLIPTEAITQRSLLFLIVIGIALGIGFILGPAWSIVLLTAISFYFGVIDDYLGRD